MISNKLLKARAYEDKNIPVVDPERPRFHLTGGIGWINDPNGFSVYKGEYHMFFQYHPYDTKWGPMYWGHVKTGDFIHWDRLPVAMAPDTEYDADGCFSGGAVEMPDGRHLLMYTGVKNETDENGKTVSFQTQCVAFGDGIHYEKFARNPVISANQIPDGGSVYDFRDPHVWREGDKYLCVVGNRTADNSGTVLMYESEDAIHWNYVNKVASCHNRYGTMWECPDFFRLDGKDVLLISPTDMKASGLEFHPGSGTVCIIGYYDKQSEHLIRENIQAIDYGLDFYAPQTIETIDGRRVMIGWMQNWATCAYYPEGQKFMGQMTIARELEIKNGRLYQNPVKEIESCRKNKLECRNVTVEGNTVECDTEIRGRFIDMTVSVKPVESVYRSLCIEVAHSSEYGTRFCFEPDRNLIRIDRTDSGLASDIVNIREIPVTGGNGEIKLRFIMDRYSIELFVNNGEQAASTIIYTPLDADEIVFSCEGKAIMSVDKYDLEIQKYL